MRVYLKTSITPEIQVYDSKAEPGPSLIRDFLSPVIVIKDDQDNVQYVYGEYKASMLGPMILLIGAGLIALKIVRRR